MPLSKPTQVFKRSNFGDLILPLRAEDLSILEEPHIIPDAYGILCMRGHVGLFINGRAQQAEAGCLCSIVPNAVAQIDHVSPDFEGYLMMCQASFLEQVYLPFGASFRQAFVHHPCIELAPSEHEVLLSYIGFVSSYQSTEGHRYREEALKHLMQATIYEIIGIYHRRLDRGDEATHSTRQGYFWQFEDLLAQHYAESREVGFYADKLFITKQYLSKICVELVQMTASEYINCYVMNLLRVHLRDTERSILQISEQFGFANPSHFTQYFRRHAGVTPSQYRRRLQH